MELEGDQGHEGQSRKQDGGGALGPVLAAFVAEAQSDPYFASLWHSDDASRAYAMACLRLSPLETLSDDERRLLYHEVATRQRRTLLAKLAGIDVAPSALRVLARCTAPDFRASDWRMLLQRLNRPRDHQSFVPIPRIGPRLVRQIDAIPLELRRPGLLSFANRNTVPAEHWRQLSEALDGAGPLRRRVLVRSCDMIRSLATFYDFFYMVTDASRCASRFPQAPDLGPRLPRLADSKALRREGLSMCNCLADLVDNAASGAWAYYSWTGNERATVALRRSNDGWRLVRASGVGNAVLSQETERSIRDLVAHVLAPGSEPTSAIPRIALTGDLDELAAHGRGAFSLDQRAQAVDALRAIRGRSVGPSDGAFCIIGYGPFYVQSLANVEAPEYLVEIVSHRSIPMVEACIDERAVAMLSSAGFRWPRGEDNFSRYVPVRDADDCADLADAALGTLHFLFGYRSGDAVSIEVHIPS